MKKKRLWLLSLFLPAGILADEHLDSLKGELLSYQATENTLMKENAQKKVEEETLKSLLESFERVLGNEFSLEKIEVEVNTHQKMLLDTLDQISAFSSKEIPSFKNIEEAHLYRNNIVKEYNILLKSIYDYENKMYPWLNDLRNLENKTLEYYVALEYFNPDKDFQERIKIIHQNLYVTISYFLESLQKQKDFLQTSMDFISSSISKKVGNILEEKIDEIEKILNGKDKADYLMNLVIQWKMETFDAKRNLSFIAFWECSYEEALFYDEEAKKKLNELEKRAQKHLQNEGRYLTEVLNFIQHQREVLESGHQEILKGGWQEVFETQKAIVEMALSNDVSQNCRIKMESYQNNWQSRKERNDYDKASLDYKILMNENCLGEGL